MIYWMYELPTWLFGTVIVSAFTVVPPLLLMLAQPHIRRRLSLNEETNGIVGVYFSSACVFYGLLLGFIAVNTWQNFADVSSTVSKEAAQIGALYRDANSYPEPYRSELQQSLKEYTHFIIEKAWPAQKLGIVPNEGEDIMAGFQDYLRSFVPANLGEQAMHFETLRAFNDLFKMRRLRLDAVSTSLPAVFWIVVLLGTSLTIATTYFFHFSSLKLHVFFTAVTGFLIGLLIFLTAALDNPFRGGVYVGPDSYVLILESVMERTDLKPKPGPGQNK